MIHTGNQSLENAEKGVKEDGQDHEDVYNDLNYYRRMTRYLGTRRRSPGTSTPSGEFRS